MWAASFLVLFAILTWHFWLTSAKRGLGIAIFASLLIPTWVKMGYQYSHPLVDAIGFPVDVRVALAFVGVPCLFFQFRTLKPLKFHWIDGLMAGILILHLAVDSYHTGFNIGLLLRIYGEWCLPYLTGRLIICNIDDVKGLLGTIVVVSCLLSVLAVIECLAETNLFEVVFGNRPEDGASREMERWGYKRSFGPLMHALYFGVLQILLLPWCLYSASIALKRGKQTWYLLGPVSNVIGVFATLSRGPILTIGVVAYVFTWLLKPRWTTSMIVVGFCLLALAVVFGDRATSIFEQWSGETDIRKQKKIEIGDERVTFTGTQSRLLLFRVYAPGIRQAGLTGFGTEAVTGFPVKVPILEGTDPKVLERVNAIDNVYVLLLLRFGWCGPILFLAAGVGSTCLFIKLALRERIGRVFFAAMAATLVAGLLLLMTVWMPHDFGFVVIMYFGIAAGLASRHRPLQTGNRTAFHKQQAQDQ